MSTNAKWMIPSPRISACMIVRNEEKFLAKCLNSISDYVDEIIVVDTGSNDRTVEIAESFGARIYHHPWEDHFSRHRNQSFGYASYDWILYIDADEELLAGSGETLRKSIMDAENDTDAIAVILECLFNDGKSMAYNNAVRLFRNNRGFYYKGRVHNYIVGVKKVLCCPIRLFHHGYNLDKTGMSRKFERTTKLLKLDIADDPSDPRPHHFLSASYLSENMPKEALKEASESIALCETKQAFSHNYFWSIYIAASACLNLGKKEEARAFAKKGIRIFPDHLDSHYILSLIAHEDHNREEFETHYRNYLRIKETYHANPEKFGEMVLNTIGSQWFLHLLSAFLLMDECIEKEAAKEIKASILLCPDVYILNMRLGNYYFNHNRFSEAEACFRKASETKPHDTAPKRSLALICERTIRHQEQADLLEEILNINHDEPGCLFSLGLCRMKMGQFDKAESAFTRVIDLNPENILAIINKAICLNDVGRYSEVAPLLQGLICEDHALKSVILSNLAYSLFATGTYKEATDVFHDLESVDPKSFYPPVFLSRICIMQNDIDACIKECGRLISLLEVRTDRTLNSIEDLALYYIYAAKKLIELSESTRLIKESLETSLLLSNNNPSLLTDIGILFIETGLPGIGADILKSAFLLSSPDDDIRKKIIRIINSNSAIIDASAGLNPSPK
jgi:glycosyltransferase involved in cell wall biosynthesis/Flp pilus assembly protein TadD